MKTHISEPPKQQNQSSSARPLVRPKLNVNTPGDAHEQEADATADKVMRMQTPASPGSPGKPANGRYYDPWRPHVRDPFVTPRGYNRNGEYYDPYRPQDTEPFGPRPKPKAVQRNPYLPEEYSEDGKLSPKETPVQRKCSSCEEEDQPLQRKEGKESEEEKTLHRKEGSEEDKMLHRKENNGAETQAGGSLDSYVNSLGSSGQPLPDASREFFEPRFGHDFSGVKIHNDSVAAKSAQSINALAYTTGNNIVFNEGQYAPGSDSGDRLLAHELTHVVQQGGAADLRPQGNMVQRQSPKHKQEHAKNPSEPSGGGGNTWTTDNPAVISDSGPVTGISVGVGYKDHSEYSDFSRSVTIEGDKALSQNKAPSGIKGEIAMYDADLINTYIEAANNGLIRRETVEAWMNLKEKMMLLEHHNFGATAILPDDKRILAAAAAAAKSYYALIKKDTANGRRNTSSSSSVHPGSDRQTTTETTSNPYTGESGSTAYTGMGSPSHVSSEIHLDNDIESKNIEQARADMKLLDEGFNLWVADQMAAKSKDKGGKSSQLQGVFALKNDLADLSANNNITKIQRVNCLYYSYGEFRTGKKIEAAPLPVYIYFDTQQEAWYIVDYVVPGKPFIKGIGASKNAPPPVEKLFRKLDDADHLPEGYIVYSSTDGSFRGGKVAMTEPMDPVKVLSVVAAITGIIALSASVALTAGADAPVALGFITALAGGISATAGVTAAGLDLGRNIEDHTSAAGQVTMDIATIVASIAGAGAFKAGGIIRAADEGMIASGSLAKLAHAFYVPLKITVLGADATNLLILSADARQQLDEIGKSKMDDASRRTAITLLVGQLALAGTLFVVSVRGNAAEIRNQGLTLRQSKSGNLEVYEEGNHQTGKNLPVENRQETAHGERPTHEPPQNNLSEQTKEDNFAKKAQNDEGVVLKIRTDDGHTLKLDKEARIAECSTCEVYEVSHKDVLAKHADLAKELKGIRTRLEKNLQDPLTKWDLENFDRKVRLQKAVDHRSSNQEEGVANAPEKANLEKEPENKLIIKNSEFAGKTFSFDLEKNPIMKKRLMKNGRIPDKAHAKFAKLAEKYPSGVKFNAEGFPDFSPYAETLPNKEVGIIELQTTGDRVQDFFAFDTKAGISEAYRKTNQLTWHHVENMTTNILMKMDIHDAVRHTGGIGVYNASSR